MSKKNRHQVIKEIIRGEKIINQDVLLSRLIDEGFSITQATLSRDMKELKVIKAPTSGGVYAYQLSEDIQNPENDDKGIITAMGFISIEFSGQLAVIKTRPGYAMAIAGEIDQKATADVLGTVAGDDTILIIPKENRTREEVINALSNFIPTIK